MTTQVNKIKSKARPETKGKKKQNGFVKTTHSILDGSFIRHGSFSQKLFFILFIAGLGLIYIANNHIAEKKIREIDRLRTLNKELSFDYLRMKTRLNEKKRASYLTEKLMPYGIKPSVEPPQKIFTNP